MEDGPSLYRLPPLACVHCSPGVSSLLFEIFDFVRRWPGLFVVTVSDRERFFVEARKTDDSDAASIVEEV
jgi:hypothetical protein